MRIEDILNQSFCQLEEGDSAQIKIGKLYNRTKLKFKFSIDISSIYCDIKEMIDQYVIVIKDEKYGYDSLNIEKLESAIQLLSYKEQLAVYRFLISTLARELPNLERDWILRQIYKVRVSMIMENASFIDYPKAFLLYTSMNIWRLMFFVLLSFLTVVIILMPAPYEWMEMFKVTKVTYSQNQFINHILNVVSLFGDFDNDLKVLAINGVAVFIKLFGKLFFILLIVNFIFKKISDKLTIE